MDRFHMMQVQQKEVCRIGKALVILFLLFLVIHRSTTDNIFIMRQILEKCYEYKIEMHLLFIDFKQAFDSVDRQKTIQILQELRIPN
jgi:hypothetical protein